MILIGHVLEQLATIPAESVHCCVTSPPYWGLRAYGTDPQAWPSGWIGEYGSEPDIETFIANTVDVFRGVRRVLRNDGLLWLNIGDSYASGGGEREYGSSDNATGRGPGTKRIGTAATGLKSGDLCNIPNRVAMALQADGWYWRQTIVWNKPAPMPESMNGWRWERCKVKTGRKPVDWNSTPKGWDVGSGSHDTVGEGNYRKVEKRDATIAVYGDCPGCKKCESNEGYVLRKGRWRCTNSWESIFLFAKSDQYFSDAERVKEKATGGAKGSRFDSGKTGARNGGERTQEGYRDQEQRNPRSVWTMSTEPFKGAHFATFPGMLPYRCIQASTSAGGCCAECGSQYAPIVEKCRVPTRPALNNKIWKHAEHGDANGQRSDVSPNLDPQRHIQLSNVLGYRPTCNCKAEVARPVVLDPFLGSGTTAAVAEYLNCDWYGCELNPAYAEIARQRIANGWKPREKKSKKAKRRKKHAMQKELFG